MPAVLLWYCPLAEHPRRVGCDRHTLQQEGMRQNTHLTVLTAAPLKPPTNAFCPDAERYPKWVTSVKLVEIPRRFEVAMGQAAWGGIWSGSHVILLHGVSIPSAKG